MDAIQHHQMIQKQLDALNKAALIQEMPQMADFTLIRIQEDLNSPNVFDTTWIKGDVIMKIRCKDGLLIFVRIPCN